MKVVMVNGQNHKGSTYHIGRMLAEKLACEQDITEFFLPRDLNHFCLGCYSCIEDETRCPFWAEKKPILDALERADIFVFTSPNYCLAPSAAMKSFLDMMFDCWMVHRPKAWMFSKRAVVVSTSAGAANGSAMAVVQKSLLYWGVPDIRTYGRAVQASNWGMVKPEKKARIEADMARLAKKLRTDRTPRVGLKTRLIFLLMRKMHAAGWDSSPTEKAHWQVCGWLGSARPWKEPRKTRDL